MIRSGFIGFIIFWCLLAQAQNTVGTTLYENATQEGYTFFSPFSSTKAYMVDNCGNLINEWDRGTRPGLSAYFLDNGLMLRTYKAVTNGPFTSASNAGGLELVDWDNNTVWSYEINTEEQLSHHDAVMMANGNILVLTWKLIYTDDLVAWGRDPMEIAQENFMWSERILEIKPIGTNQAEIVWEWNIYDHYIQDFDPSKMNYGIISEHPELFNINLPELNSSNSNSTRDWNHFNAIDYNESLDQILISVRNSDEIWILDHSTSTEEAATHEGGIYGKGGDILYRWGNPSAYETAEVSAQQLFGQHGVHWIKEGLGGPNTGKILIFNNGNQRPGPDYSQIDVLNPPQSVDGFYIQESGIPNAPLMAETLYGDNSDETFYSAYLSNAQYLPNGNVLVNAGSPGTIFEVDANRNKMWEYVIPLFGDFPATQGDNINNNSNFRAYKFAPDFAGFNDIDIVSGDPIENDPTACEILVNVTPVDDSEITVFYNSDRNSLLIKELGVLGSVELMDISGKILLTETIESGNTEVFLTERFPSGIYSVRVLSGASMKVVLVRL